MTKADDRLIRVGDAYEYWKQKAQTVTDLANAKTLRNMLDEVPPAEPERKTGKWIIFPPCIEEICMCSNCKTKFKKAYQTEDTCPSCGAKME